MSKKQRDRLQAEAQQQLEQRQRERAAEGAPAGTPACRGHPPTPTSTRHGGMEPEPRRLEGTERDPGGDGDRDGDGDGPGFCPHPGVSSLLESPTSSGVEIGELLGALSPWGLGLPPTGAQGWQELVQSWVGAQ